ncbi:OmpA family protein [uncultured Thiodictyon sp.]|uniref:OmpA family protein n=1 Tax=uncultured Thiodictyon sp. TaxID=1846217 RepID=UPI0025D3F04F|nr:OmpA family protein [uncultured Thiodictyon sp.]
MQVKAHPLPHARRPLSIPPQWRRLVMTLVAGGSALILGTLAVAPSPAGAATAGSESAKPHAKTETAKPRAKTETAKSHSKTEAAATPKARTSEAAKHKPKHPSVGRPAKNPAPVKATTPPTANLSEPKSAAASTPFEHGPGVLGMSQRTLRQEKIQAYVTKPVAMVALALDHLRFSPVNKGTHVEVNLADRIPFDSKGDKVASKARRPLDVLSRILTDNPQTRIQVVVHTDDTGEPEDNLRQSQRAAEAVKAYMMAKGVAAERIAPIGRGSEAPLVAIGNRTPTWLERSRNKRVELVIEPLVPVPAQPTDGPTTEKQSQPGRPDGPMLGN